MTVLFFLYALLFTASAWNIWRPRRSMGPVVVVSFIAQLIGGLFALQIVVVNLVLGVLFYVGGASSGGLGALAALLHTGALLSYLWFHLRSHMTQAVVEEALRSGLGGDYRHQTDDDLCAQFATGLDIKRIIKPLPQDLPGVEIIKDLPYTEDKDIRALDIYRKTDHGENRPVLLQIHGGAWTENMGSKNEQARPLMNHMALRDWICVSVGYRLSPSVQMPAHIIDVKTALLWVKDHIAEYGGDPNFIIATGGSAGGHLSALLGVSANDPLLQPDAPDRDTSVQGCVPYYGAVDLLNELGEAQDIEKMMADKIIGVTRSENPELWDAVSPLQRVHGDAPPYLVICGDADNLVPVATNSAFARRLDEAGASVCYAEIPHAGHAFDMIRNPHSEYVVYGIERWLAYQYSRYREALTVLLDEEQQASAGA